MGEMKLPELKKDGSGRRRVDGWMNWCGCFQMSNRVGQVWSFPYHFRCPDCQKLKRPGRRTDKGRHRPIASFASSLHPSGQFFQFTSPANNIDTHPHELQLGSSWYFLIFLFILFHSSYSPILILILNLVLIAIAIAILPCPSLSSVNWWFIFLLQLAITSQMSLYNLPPLKHWASSILLLILFGYFALIFTLSSTFHSPSQPLDSYYQGSLIATSILMSSITFSFYPLSLPLSPS